MNYYAELHDWYLGSYFLIALKKRGLLVFAFKVTREQSHLDQLIHRKNPRFLITIACTFYPLPACHQPRYVSSCVLSLCPRINCTCQLSKCHRGFKALDTWFIANHRMFDVAKRLISQNPLGYRWFSPTSPTHTIVVHKLRYVDL